MACVFLARLIDFDCDFPPRNLESASRGPQFSFVSKIQFPIPQTIVQYRTDIRQPAKTGGLRKIKIGGTRLTLRRSNDWSGKTDALLEYASRWRIFLMLINRL
jgi:hypothetical protein